MGIEYTHRKRPTLQRVPQASPVRITHADGTVEVHPPLPTGRAINRRGKALTYRKRRKRN